jgi:hypothetical protein
MPKIGAQTHVNIHVLCPFLCQLTKSDIVSALHWSSPTLSFINTGGIQLLQTNGDSNKQVFPTICVLNAPGTDECW